MAPVEKLAHVIVASGIDNTQRSLIQSWVKENAGQWWHQLPDVWVVVGKTALELRDGLQPFMLPATSVLIFAIKNSKGGRWSAANVKNTDWFTKNLPPAPEAVATAKAVEK